MGRAVLAVKCVERCCEVDVPSSERQVFAAEAGPDAGTGSRARGWALWRALITGSAESERVVREILNDPALAG